MTLDEAIKHAEEVAEENRNVDEGELDLLYCGDTECIEAHKSNCIACAKEHEQLAKWLKELKQLREQTRWIPCNEKMPEEHEWIGTKRFGTTISNEVYVTFENPEGERFVKHLSFQNGALSSFDQSKIDAFYKGSVPIAWRSLPEPYEAESEAE